MGSAGRISRWVLLHPEIQVCERLPEVAKVMDKVTLIRSMTHNMKNHNSASYYALTGHAPPLDDIRLRDSVELFPAYGSVVSRLAPAQDASVPSFVAYPYVCRDGSITPGQHASFLGKVHDPLLITEDPNAADFKLPELSLPAGVSIGRLENRRELQKLVDKQSRLLDYSAEARGIDAHYDRALAMLNSDKVRKAFDLSKEPAELRDKYGRHSYGQSCLLARRLVEAGVRFVNVYFSDSIGGQSTERGGWDTHGFNNTRMFPIVEKYHFPITEQTLPTFLRDMDDRGLLETTLVVWMGEFGRTPKINDNISRDHWPQCYTTLLAGGWGEARVCLWRQRQGRGLSRARSRAARRPGGDDVLSDGHRPAHGSLRRAEPAAFDWRRCRSGRDCVMLRVNQGEGDAKEAMKPGAIRKGSPPLLASWIP